MTADCSLSTNAHPNHVAVHVSISVRRSNLPLQCRSRSAWMWHAGLYYPGLLSAPCLSGSSIEHQATGCVACMGVHIHKQNTMLHIGQHKESYTGTCQCGWGTYLFRFGTLVWPVACISKGALSSKIIILCLTSALTRCHTAGHTVQEQQHLQCFWHIKSCQTHLWEPSNIHCDPQEHKTLLQKHARSAQGMCMTGCGAAKPCAGSPRHSSTPWHTARICATCQSCRMCHTGQRGVAGTSTAALQPARQLACKFSPPTLKCGRVHRSGKGH